MSLPYEIDISLTCDGDANCRAMRRVNIAMQTVPGRYEVCYGDPMAAIDQALAYAAWTRCGNQIFCPVHSRPREEAQEV